MAKVPWKMLCDEKWEEANPDKWCIYNAAWEGGRHTSYAGGWYAYHPQVLDGVEHPYEGFPTHAEATAYVRSKIAKQTSTA